ncbi:hypothetical protein VPH35_111186 [Triticum aestivum]
MADAAGHHAGLRSPIASSTTRPLPPIDPPTSAGDPDRLSLRTFCGMKEVKEVVVVRDPSYENVFEGVLG